ncbi:iron-containing alcohol dehydrogenase [Clostridium sp. CM028]|uniref:iron-containing alcohol dehydrogenase n=1 Tax=unclassified Clostridium TaxID=2614128 RepID=UPI001C0B7DEE|nr:MULTISPECIES: iron-containing alcohol dehydrogenase [unclassified Clostridium]MBU3091280.1 iron-containing alcohol dehydrogenase [Clostridium sp. CF011]MBW9146841.1 iron-containing alcohol dehydrogenase [Clostridium sp. CM027]MBW9150138.1 iron-containing alcohol dehydrogenase [Clostridium sp. CM028]UVE39680.1 iron-containing alcohol dehydrogenase [Clostridium sp. CM027]WAG68587.1 iron-containing alcohol dehydrogenase [Clostridium sp. CF011]
MNRFTLPRDIYFGENSLEVLKTLKGRKAVIVTGGSSMKRFGFLDTVEAYLKEAGIEVKHITGVEPDPSVETVMNGAAVMREFQPDLIVSIGGGSPIDAAKAMWIFYEYPEFTFEQAVIPFGIPDLRQKAKFIAIPSTSGTATEVTAFSVITDYKAKIKYPLADFNLTPDIAIVDPALAQTMPPKLVAHTGMDALTHAFEAYVAGLRSSFSDPLAIQAITMIRENILKSFEGDVEARNEMHIAQCLAGMAFSNALLGISHSMAHKIGGVFHVAHGLANAILLPYVIDFNKKSCGDRYATIARSLNLAGNTEDELIDSLTDMIRDLNKAMNIPTSLKENGMTKEEFDANVDFISENAIKDACTGSNPRPINTCEMKKILTCTFTGEKVKF